MKQNKSIIVLTIITFITLVSLILFALYTISNEEGDITTNQVLKTISSDDYYFNRAIIHRQEEHAFEVEVISWEYVSNNMILIKGKISGGTMDYNIGELKDKYYIPYDFLVSENNVTFYTIEEKVLE